MLIVRAEDVFTPRRERLRAGTRLFFFEGNGVAGGQNVSESFSPSEVKAIMHSKRANLYYLEKCRVMQKDGRVFIFDRRQK